MCRPHCEAMSLGAEGFVWLHGWTMLPLAVLTVLPVDCTLVYRQKLSLACHGHLVGQIDVVLPQLSDLGLHLLAVPEEVA